MLFEAVIGCGSLDPLVKTILTDLPAECGHRGGWVVDV
jgi:hypothetical protein